MASQTGNKGQWSAVQLPDYYAEPYGTTSTQWAMSPLYNQLSTLDIGTKTIINSVSYVSAVNINLIEISNQKYSTSGVKVWFRWMKDSLFYTTGDIGAQKLGNEEDPGEWQLIGTYRASSFTTAIPRSVVTGGSIVAPTYTLSSDMSFQILVTDNTTIVPNKWNYRYMGNVTAGSLTKLGESASTNGYLPWNPGYAQATNNNPWTTYMRQRSTLQDIAIFYPRRWQQ